MLQIPRDDTEVVLLSLLTFEALDLRQRSIDLLTGSSPTLVRSITVQVEQYPELAGLRQDSRYLKLVSSDRIRSAKGDNQWR